MAVNSQFQPPPTHANPMLEVVDPATGKTKVTFNPVWLKWFLDLTTVMTNSGGGNSNSTISLSMLDTLIAFGNSDNVLFGSDEFRWDYTNRKLLLGDIGTGGTVSGVPDGSNNTPGAVVVGSADGGGNGGTVTVRGGDSVAAVGGEATVVGGYGDTVGGTVRITGGDGNSSVGGHVIISAGSGATQGEIALMNLPTAAPATSGALWRDAAAGNVVKCVP